MSIGSVNVYGNTRGAMVVAAGMITLSKLMPNRSTAVPFSYFPLRVAEKDACLIDVRTHSLRGAQISPGTGR